MQNKTEIIRWLGIQNQEKANIIADIWLQVVKSYNMDGDKVIIISDEDYNKGVTKSKEIGLFKVCWTYNMEKEIISQSKYEERLKIRKSIEEQERKKKQREAEQTKKKQEYEIECNKLGYPHYNELADGKIQYYTQEPGVRYYWSKIGNNYIVRNTGDLAIDKKIYKEIERERKYGLDGSSFLGRAFVKQGSRKSYRITGYYEDKNEVIKKQEQCNYGVYAIYYENELLYIGMTMRGFSSRWQNHIDIFKGIEEKPANMILYNAKVDPDKLVFKVLFNASNALTEEQFTKRDIEMVELAYITNMQPKYNLRGMTCNYYFSKEK